MQKIIKRIIILTLAVVIAASAPLAASARTPDPVFAEEPTVQARVAQTQAQEVSMEKALVAVKSLIDIDDDVFTEFSYSSYFSNFETREGLVWSFSWSDAANAHINAQATSDGVLLHFRKFQWDGKSFGFAEISKEAATTAANEFLKRANPGIYSFFKAPASINTSIHNSEYTLHYSAEVNGHAFDAARITINVNKFTGVVSGYNTRNINPEGFRFESAENLITESAAIAAYVDKIGLSLEYRSVFDFENNKITVIPVYLFNSFSDRFISARTGEVVTYVYDAGSVDDVALGAQNLAAREEMSEADAAGGQRASITPAERAAIEQVAGFLTSEQALQRLLAAAEITDLDVASFTDQHISLGRDFFDRERFFYDVNLYRFIDWTETGDELTGVFGRVNAATGRVMSFTLHYNGTPMASGQGVVTEVRAREIVDTFLKRMAPEELARTKMEDFRAPEVVPFGFRGGNYHFRFIRYENDVPFRDNGINVTFNQNIGKITSYSLEWFDNVTFPSVANVLTPQQALTAFVGFRGSTISYITTGGGNASIVYDFRSWDTVDPFTGKAIDFMGTPMEQNFETPDYRDVSGHWSERYVNRLLDNGVFLWGGDFEPDKVMTEFEFLQFIMLVEGGPMPRSEMQHFLNWRGINIEASSERNLTRQAAARIIVEYLGFAKLAEQSRWFVYPFIDNVAEEYKGYITICYMLGIVSGDNNRRFNASNNVTRGHAAAMLHNLIISRS